MSRTINLAITSPDPEKTLQYLAEMGYILHDVRMTDTLTVTVTVSREDGKVIERHLGKKGYRVVSYKKAGLYWKATELIRRPVLLAGLVIYIFFAVYIPSHIYFVQVTGNETVSERKIVEAAAACGVGFGANRRSIRSEKVKNALLQEIPELQWVGVNTVGCVAVISVKEREPTVKPVDKTPCSIVAARDCVIRKITVIQGTPLCKVGDGVKAGQVLVSGYKDYGIAQQLSYAEAEIYGETEHKISVVAPDSAQFRGAVTGEETKYSLVFGKKQINLYKDSGISPASCVKMYKRTYLTLPGGFVLPVALVTQTIVYYTTESKQTSDVSYLSVFAEEYLRSQMIAGSVLKAEGETESAEGICSYLGTYSCLELVGYAKNEEFIKENG